MAKKTRLRFLVKPKLQIGITLEIMMILAMFIAVLIGFMYLIANQNVPILENFLIRRQFEAGMHTFIYELIGMAVVVLIGVFIFGIYVTHRIAGSLFAIERYLDQLLEGSSNIEDLKLRKNSDLQPLADRINRLRKRLN